MEQIDAPRKKEGHKMTTENSNNSIEMTPSNDTAETAPKRTMTQASEDRIAYHVNVSLEKMFRLNELELAGKKETPAYARCKASLEKNEAVIAQLKAALEARLAKKSSNSVAA